MILVTNNTLISDEMAKTDLRDEVVYRKCSYLDICLIAKEKIGKGHKLLINPIMGSVPPYEMPYKTIVLSDKCGTIDFPSVNLINSSIKIIQTAIKERPKGVWGDGDLLEFRKNDLVNVAGWLRVMRMVRYT